MYIIYFKVLILLSGTNNIVVIFIINLLRIYKRCVIYSKNRANNQAGSTKFDAIIRLWLPVLLGHARDASFVTHKAAWF